MYVISLPIHQSADATYLDDLIFVLPIPAGLQLLDVKDKPASTLPYYNHRTDVLEVPVPLGTCGESVIVKAVLLATDCNEAPFELAGYLYRATSNSDPTPVGIQTVSFSPCHVYVA